MTATPPQDDPLAALVATLETITRAYKESADPWAASAAEYRDAKGRFHDALDVDTVLRLLDALRGRAAILRELVIEGFVQHDSWRCGYYVECHCGLDGLLSPFGIVVPRDVQGGELAEAARRLDGGVQGFEESK